METFPFFSSWNIGSAVFHFLDKGKVEKENTAGMRQIGKKRKKKRRKKRRKKRKKRRKRRKRKKRRRGKKEGTV